jgi:hypothetical protein
LDLVEEHAGHALKSKGDVIRDRLSDRVKYNTVVVERVVLQNFMLLTKSSTDFIVLAT